MSYASVLDTGPCEGRQASPSNPSKSKRTSRSSERGDFDAVVVFRCTASEKRTLIEKAERAGLPFADLMREALGLVETRRRKPVPRVDPELIRSLGRIGANVNQIARWLNGSVAAGRNEPIEAIALAAQLIAVDRALHSLIEVCASSPSNVGDGRC